MQERRPQRRHNHDHTQRNKQRNLAGPAMQRPHQLHVPRAKRNRKLRPHRILHHLHGLQRQPRHRPGRPEDRDRIRSQRIVHRQLRPLNIQCIAQRKSHERQRRPRQPLDLLERSVAPPIADPRNIALHHEAKNQRHRNVRQREHHRRRARPIAHHHRNQLHAKRRQRQAALQKISIGE